MRAGLKNARFRKVLETVSYTIPATNLSAARPLHTHVPLLAKESSLYYEGCIGGKTGFSTEAQNCLATVAERNGRTYIVVTMRDADLGINCADSTVLFDYAFNSFDSIEVDGKAMTVPKGVTAADLTMESKQKGNKNIKSVLLSGAVCRLCNGERYTGTGTGTGSRRKRLAAEEFRSRKHIGDSSDR